MSYKSPATHRRALHALEEPCMSFESPACNGQARMAMFTQAIDLASGCLSRAPETVVLKGSKSIVYNLPLLQEQHTQQSMMSCTDRILKSHSS